MLNDKNNSEFDQYHDDDQLAFLPSTGAADKPYLRHPKKEQLDEKFEDDDTSLFNKSFSEIMSDKTGFTLTAITIAKSYIGVGCLAIPYGFNLCGYQLGLLMLSLSAVLTFFCCWFMTEASKFYGGSEIKTFSDFGKKLWGRPGHIIVFTIYYTNQYCTCVSYVIFFLGTFHEYFTHV